MADNLQQNQDQQKGPFSPLQTGCAVVMLTNMVIYLGVVLFTFNLLDPSKIDASYLAKRGFKALPTPKSEQDIAFQQLSKEKRQQQQQIQNETVDASKTGIKQEPSPAARLSQIDSRKLKSSIPNEPEKPKATLTQSSIQYSKTAYSAQKSRRSVADYSQTTLDMLYSRYRLYVPKTITPERYETLPVELAQGINIPTFNLPLFGSGGPYLYTPINPIPEASRSGLKLSSPPVGAESLYTNETKNAKEPPNRKPRKEPAALPQK